MKIAAIKTTPLALAFKEPYHWAGRVDCAAAVVLVEVETDDGLVGVGESVAAFPAEGTVAALQGVAPLFLGQPVFDVERLVTGARFALLYAGSAQLIFLIGFGYAFFFEGYAGLAVTIGALATLFVLMQVTGRVKWADVFHDADRPAVPPLGGAGIPRQPGL